ncbi:hypothetical protein PMAYCL1PPCAC_21346, partial [Pristionchus mayeri]
MSDLESCMRGRFDGPTLGDRLNHRGPIAVFTAIGLHFNIVLCRIITIQKVILFTNFTIALDRFLIFSSPNIYKCLSGSKKHYFLVLLPWFLASWIVFLFFFLTNDTLRLRTQRFSDVVQFLIITVVQLVGSYLFKFDFNRDIIINSAVSLSASSWTTYTNAIVMFVFNKRVRRCYLTWGRRLWIFKRDLTTASG